MDSLTHIVLGAAIGEVALGNRLGKKALLIGAIAQSVPDVDFVASFFMQPADDLLAHRAFTHSWLFVALLAPLSAYLADRWRLDHRVRFPQWAGFFALQLAVHILLDTFNAYGTGWFVPFSNHRFSFNALFVADPFYSFPLAIVFIFLLFLRKTHSSRRMIALTGLVVSSLYLGYTLANKYAIDRSTRTALEAQGIQYHRYFTTPTPLNNWLWFLVAEVDGGFQVAHHSVLANKKEIEFYFFPRNDSLLARVEDHETLQRLKRFSQGYYTVEWQHDTLTFNDLRFGQMAGWADPHAGFVFHYYLNHPEDNDLVIQRGRFTHWNRSTLESMIRQIFQ